MNAINLGLSELLDSAAKASSEGEDSTSALPSVEDGAGENGPVPDAISLAPDASVYELLARSAAWEELAALSEQRVEDGGAESQRARVWWIKSQAEIKGVPLGMLAAPLEEAVAGIDNLPPTERKLIGEILISFVRAFKDQGEAELALVFARRAYSLGLLEKTDLKGFINSEIARLRAIDDRRRISELSQKISALESELDTSMAGSKAPEVNKTIDAENGKHSASIDDSPLLASDHEQVVKPKKIGEFDILKGIDTRPREGRAIASAIVGFLILLVIISSVVAGAWYLKLGEWFGLGGGVSSVAPQLVFDPTTPTTLTPVLEDARNPSGLDAIYYEIGASENSHKVESRVPDQQQDSIRTAKMPENSSADSSSETPTNPALQGSNVQKDRGAKETVDTSSPVEQVRPRDERRPDDSAPEDRRSPLFDRPDGRMRSDWESTTQSRGEEFAIERYPRGRWFRIIASTPVMERPSSRSYEVARLESGDKVVAERRVGEWIELRSQSGRPGFINVHDTKED